MICICFERRPKPVRRACPRRGWHIQHRHRLMHRFREQARSHIGPEANRQSSVQPEFLWEWACP
ncbi:hypothetical protein CXF97_16395 [Pseudomonas sp. Choline-02u-1]|nr:hypothetical protein CXF97_16395 [Pseudomonas sp. Choline-02u-1]